MATIAAKTKLLIKHERYGEFQAVAKYDFDTTTPCYFVQVGGDSPVQGITRSWQPGDDIPCRKAEVIHLDIVHS